jgi:flagellar motility protein MotE (MotC chaperone)
MKTLLRHIRLLPAVIIVGMCLLGLKSEGLIRAAWAQEQPTAPDDAAVLAKDTAPLAKDPADEDAASSSAAEVDVLTSLSKRRAALDAREADIAMRADLLAAAEKRVDGKIATLKQLQDQITALLGQRDTAQDEQMKSLVKTYSAMKPKDAARIFNNLSDDVLVPVAHDMKPDVLAAILANMNPDAAQKLTVKLANRLKLPETTGMAAPVAALPDATQTSPGAAPSAPQAVAAPAPATPSPAPQAGSSGKKS